MPRFVDMSFEQRMRLVFDQVQERALLTLDRDGYLVDWSYGAEQLFGWTAQEATGQLASLIFTPEDIAADVPGKEMALALQNGRAPDTRWHIRKDGSRFFADGSLTALRREDGSVAGYAKSLREATAAMLLRESEAKFKAMINATPHMVWSSLADGTADYFNERMGEFTGLPVDELKGSRWTALVHPDDLPPIWEAWQYSIQTGRPFHGEFRFRHLSGEYRWILCRGEPVRDDCGQVIRWMGTNTDIHGQKIAQARLAASEELFRSLVTATSQVVWQADTNGDVLKDSPSWRAFTGQTYEEWKGAGWLNALHPDDRERAATMWAKATAERVIYDIEYRVRHVSGQYRWTQARGVPILDLDGTIREWVGTNTDITEKKQTEIALREAQLRLEATLKAAEVGTFTWDIQANRVYADANMARLHNVGEIDANGGPAEAYFNTMHPDDVQGVKERLDQAIADKQPYQLQYRLRMPDDSLRFMHIRSSVQTNQDGTASWIAGVALDITALRVAESALLKREERYHALFNSIEEGFYIIEMIHDENGHPVDYRFLEANPSAEHLNGLRNVVGRTLREMIPAPTMSWLVQYDKVAKTGVPLRFADYSKVLNRWFDISVTRVGSESGKQVVLLFSDITERKQNEDDLRRLAAELSQANRRQGEFLATLAHELRNPLAPIRAGLDLINASMETAPPMAKVHEIMSRQVDHLTHLVNDLMDLARINSGKIELQRGRYSLAEIVKNAVEVALPVIQEKSHDLVMNFAEEPIWVDGDKNRLTQIISNLLTNAAKYTSERGRVIVTLEREDHTAIIGVTDNGIGIAVEDQAHLFDMFSQVKRGLGHAQGGLGIGLNLVKRLTEKHGGSVSASSAGVDQGSTFTVRLPIAQHSSNTESLEEPESARDFGSHRLVNIVIADDNEDVANLLKDLLELKGHKVTTAYDGSKALEKLRLHQPDLALLDIGMPGLNGYEIAKAVRSDPALQDMVLAAATGWSSLEDRNRSERAGFNYHLSKPISHQTLLTLVADVTQKM